jgi:serine/threonine protein phosphatase 1
LIVAIGDIHAQYDKLSNLMAKLKFISKFPESINFNTTPFIFLGDVVDGGPDTKEVINQLMQWEQQYPHWVFLYGNHEDMLLDAICRGSRVYGNFYQWYNRGGAETVQSYSRDSDLGLNERLRYTDLELARHVIPQSHLAWLNNRPYYFETEHFFFVHAGVRPGDHPALTPPSDMIWLRDEFIYSPYDWGKKIIYGHTYSPEPVVRPNKIGVDTMTHSQGDLTAVILDETRPEWYTFVQSDK